ncbi:MAG: EVE domain-containing protein [Fimbriimonadaceae bacterium]|nr:EVE domain-containing protein [Fimbriimonadaceae bacterium]
MKSEPDVYSIDHLMAAGKPAMWEGCRNYTVRNFFRDSMSNGDLAFFYHSNAQPSGKSSLENPRWLLRDVEFIQKFNRVITLNELRDIEGLSEMLLLRKGQRLSVMPVEEHEWNLIMEIVQ